MANRTITITIDCDRVSSAVEEVLDVIKESRYLAGSVVKVGYTDQGKREITNQSAWAYSPSKGEARKAGIELARAVERWASDPGNHGANPYSFDHVRKANNLVALVEGREPVWRT